MDETEKNTDDIVASVNWIIGIIADIATPSAGQDPEVSQVNKAKTDSWSHYGLVETRAATAETLAGQAETLAISAPSPALNLMTFQPFPRTKPRFRKRRQSVCRPSLSTIEIFNPARKKTNGRGDA